ncbi:MAG TPA: hypothetical protein G4O07_05750 [Dehalococcoidia bacterium]|nr:hypothetical protein [Dehalococcoidia bacterium]
MLTILLAGALLMSLIPAVVYAGQGGVTGHGRGGNTKPVVSDVYLEDASQVLLIDMVPEVEYYVRATVSDVNTIDDVEYIEFYIYDDATAETSDWDADEFVIFKWDKTAGWTMENNSGGYVTSWTVEGGNCVTPSNFAVTVDDWTLAFKVGKLAKATATWKAKVRAYDEKPGGSSITVSNSATMGAFSEVGFGQGTVVLGSVLDGIEPGAWGYITDPGTYRMTTKAITNASYELQVHSTTTWTDGSGNNVTLAQGTDVPAGPSEFNLVIDDGQTGAGTGIPAVAQAVLIDTATTITGYGSEGRVEVPKNTSEGTADHEMFMGLAFSLVGIEEVDYYGTITFTVKN